MLPPVVVLPLAKAAATAHDTLPENLERKLTRLGSTLIDAKRANPIIEPSQDDDGFWFGGGNAVRALSPARKRDVPSAIERAMGGAANASLITRFNLGLVLNLIVRGVGGSALLGLKPTTRMFHLNTTFVASQKARARQEADAETEEGAGGGAAVG